MRIYTSAGNPLDFCSTCFPKTEEQAAELYGNLGDGPDGRGDCFGYAEEHPDYDGENYRCTTCGKRLTARDSFVIRPMIFPGFSPTYIVFNDSLACPGSFSSIKNAREFIAREVAR